jgi:thiamine-phosphate pyrophosphorylase
LQAAQDRARHLGAAAVRPEDLLHGVLLEEEGRPSFLLGSAGLDPDTARRALAGRPADGPAQPAETPLPLSPATRQVLDRARDLAGEVSADRTVASEQVLLAVLSLDESMRRALEAFGLDFARLEAEVLSAQGPPLELEEPLRLDEPTDRVHAARVLDASANRAREGLRVVEDFCRFVLDDAYLSGELKRMRHDLAEALTCLPPGLLLEARETVRDVGTGLTAAGEQERHSLTAVVQANLKRLQESLRSLEEYGKLHSSALGQAVERLRYRGYTLERAVLLGTTARRRLEGARLYVLLTGSLCNAALDWTIAEAAAGGAQIFQLREKNLPDRELLERARNVRRWTRQAGALFIMNDRPDLARLAEADGVHLGQDELPVMEARRILGPDALVGVSTHDLDQVRRAVLDGASYIGVGPTFPSATKRFTDFPGLDFVRRATAGTSLPAFVIGGVTAETAAAAVAAGARRVAVSQAICRADEPRLAAAELRRILEGG